MRHLSTVRCALVRRLAHSLAGVRFPQESPGKDTTLCYLGPALWVYKVVAALWIPSALVRTTVNDGNALRNERIRLPSSQTSVLWSTSSYGDLVHAT